MNKKRVRTFLATIGIVAGLFAAYMAYQAYDVTYGGWYQTQTQNCLDKSKPTASDPTPLFDPVSPALECYGVIASAQHDSWLTLWVSSGIAAGAGILWWLTGFDQDKKSEPDIA